MQYQVDMKKIESLINFIISIDAFSIQHLSENLHLAIRKRKIREYFIAAGETKVCIIPKNKQYVIKISVCRDKDKMSACGYEAEVYYKAKKESLEQFFPTTETLYDKNGICIIAQQKCDFSSAHIPFNKDNKYQRIVRTFEERDDYTCFCDKIDRDMQNFKDDGYTRYINRTWIAMSVVLYGKKSVKRLCHFLSVNNIDDLHDNNLGFINDKPIILDFSGYFNFS